MQLNLQLNTKSAYARDMEVELTNQGTGEKRTVKPYLDGQVVARNIDAGQWRAVVKHPNLLFPLYDRPIRVFPNRPTFVPVTIPDNIFENSPIADTPDANLGPAQERLAQSASAAALQGKKMAGEPIYADDWNALSGTIVDIANANSDLAKLVSPLGHDHPEIETKINEVQSNLQRFYDLFGRSLAQLQRQVQQLALQRKVDAAVGQLTTITPSQKGVIDTAIKEIGESWSAQPSIYGLKKKRAGQQISEMLALAVVESDDVSENDPFIAEAIGITAAMATEQPAANYTKEIENQHRVDERSTKSPFSEALTGFNNRGGV